MGNRDVVTDFEDPGAGAGDLTDVSAIDADTGDLDNDAFVLGNTGAFSNTPGVGELIVVSNGSGGSVIPGDVDDDLVANFEIEVTNVADNLWTQHDFIL